MSKNKKLTHGLIKAADLTDVMNCPFATERDRIRYMVDNYGHMSLAKCFGVFYDTPVDPAVKKDSKINNPVNIVVGKEYKGTVREISKDGIMFDVPGVKEEVISKENFSDCMDNVKNYLLNHDNELLFTVTSKKDGRYFVSVLDGYYKSWQKQIEKAIEQRAAITVHIDSLVRGGYMCSTRIWTINDLTGKDYTCAVFIPGSNIVLNIETDFERWLDKDVEVIPQKFTKFKAYGRPVENSLMASRKMVLKILGMKNMYEIYTRAKLANSPHVKYEPEVFKGKVTGIINSNKKTGIFIEIEDKYITGLMPVDESMLLNYRPGDIVDVYIKEFECMEGKEPFFIDRKSIIRACNVRPVFARA